MTTAPARRLFRLRPASIAFLVLIGLVEAAAITAIVLLLRRAVDELAVATRVSNLSATVWQLTGASVVLAVVRGIDYKVTESLGYDLVNRLRVHLHEHLTGMSPRTVQRSSRGALLLRFTGDLSTFRTWISRGLARGIVSSVTLLGTLGVIVVLNYRIGLTITGALFFGAAISLATGPAVRRATKAVRWRRSLMTSTIAEQLSALAVVQVYGRAAGEHSRLARQSDDVTAAQKRMAWKRGRLRIWSSLTSSAAVIGVVFVGTHEITNGRATIGVIAGALTAARFASGPIRTLGRAHEYWQASRVSREKLDDFLRRPSRVDSEHLNRLRVRKGEIVLHDVHVDGALDGVNLTIEGGRVLAVIGPNGAGKSTLLNVIARLVEPDKGEIVVDGQHLADCTARSTYRNLGMVGPDWPLMRGTVRRNVLYRYPDAGDDEFERVVLSCRLDELHGGLDQWLTEGGANLPAGHRQRIALARATLGSPRILLLDEPTTNLDEATKEIFRRVLARYRGTVVLVTHDPVEASLADAVCVLRDGRVDEYVSGDEYRARVRGAARELAGKPGW